MGAGHGHRLHYHGHSAVHRAEPHRKILALLGFVLAVVAVPGSWWPLYLVAAGVLAAVIALSRVPVTFLLPRMVVEVPFLVFALVVPFVATGPQVDLGWFTVSRPGLEASAVLVVKGTLGVLASLTLAATTESQDVVRGLERLRLPAPLVQILGFMIRYLDVVGAELGRMRHALVARGFEARNPRHWPVLARALGALFIRSYERGERVHLAMVSRGLGPQGLRSSDGRS